MERLCCTIKSYPWGGGIHSLVGILASLGGHLKNARTNTFAELWIGTHPSGTSKLFGTSIDLPAEVPFLLKVLSIRTALSIQVHPTKDVARYLHRTDPRHYPDDNHKPEVAVPLTPFEALAGLLPTEVVQRALHRFPELVATGILSIEDLLSRPDDAHRTVAAIVSRLNLKHEHDLDVTEELILRLNTHFPGDIGVLCPVFMRYHQLRPGQLMYIPPGCPHAYISGEIVECMASSDNVIRAGLTGKHKDLAALRLAMTQAQPDVRTADEFTVDGEFTIRLICGKGKRVALRKGSLIIMLDSGEAFYTFDDCTLQLDSSTRRCAIAEPPPPPSSQHIPDV